MLDDLAQKQARQSVSEHKELEDFVEKLDEQEHEVFQLADKVLSDPKQTKFAPEYRTAMEASREHAPA